MPDSKKYVPHLKTCDVDDGVVPAGLAKASAAAFQGVGFQDVTLKTYPKWVNQQLLSVDFIYKACNIVNFLQQLQKIIVSHGHLNLSMLSRGGHAAPREEIEDIRQWVTTKLQLER